MSKTVKIWLIVAVSLTVIGGVIFGGAMTMLNWDFSKLSTGNYETTEHMIDESFTDISVIAKTADVTLAPSENGQTRVVCCEHTKLRHAVTVEDGTLNIHVNDTRKWYEYIGFYFKTPTVTVYLPQEVYGSLCIRSETGDITLPHGFSFDYLNIIESTGNVTVGASVSNAADIRTSTGHVDVENAAFGALDISVTTGKVTVADVTCTESINVHVSTGKTKLANVQCRSLTSGGSTGDITLRHVIAEESFSIRRSTGDVTFDGADAKEIIVETDTGDVEGTLLSDKVFITRTDTGDVDVPKSTSGGKCDITTDTGDIEIRIR